MYLFVFCMIFTNAFALNSVITISFGLSLLLFLYGFLEKLPLIRFKEPNFLIGMYAILFFSYIFIATGEKRTNHLFLWTAPPLLYYYMFKRILIRKFDLGKILKNVLGVVYVALMLACFFAIVEFLGRNFLGIDFSFIPRGVQEDYEPGSFGGIRARSFMEESGHYSLFLEIFAPLSIYWCSKYIKSIILRFLSYILMITGLIVSFSAIGFVCMGIGVFGFLIWRFKSSKKKYGTILLALFIIGILMFIPGVYDMLTNVVSTKLDPENTSNISRSNRFDALQYFEGIYMFTGYGPAAYDTLKVDSFVSFYLGILMNTGIFGLFFYLLFIIKMYINIRDIKDKTLKFAFTLSMLFSTMHYAFVDNIYVPWFWVMLSIMCAMRYKFLRGEYIPINRD